mmetsp:Transcript_73414/g.220592  ORF Transcript_73414/g.220592 Transcript_73414/m.220592 type:complete len:305 (+) Transcript_73414:70-984(+)
MTFGRGNRLVAMRTLTNKVLCKDAVKCKRGRRSTMSSERMCCNALMDNIEPNWLRKQHAVLNSTASPQELREKATYRRSSSIEHIKKVGGSFSPLGAIRSAFGRGASDGKAANGGAFSCACTPMTPMPTLDAGSVSSMIRQLNPKAAESNRTSFSEQSCKTDAGRSDAGRPDGASLPSSLQGSFKEGSAPTAMPKSGSPIQCGRRGSTDMIKQEALGAMAHRRGSAPMVVGGSARTLQRPLSLKDLHVGAAQGGAQNAARSPLFDAQGKPLPPGGGGVQKVNSFDHRAMVAGGVPTAGGGGGWW